MANRSQNDRGGSRSSASRSRRSGEEARSEGDALAESFYRQLTKAARRLAGEDDEDLARTGRRIWHFLGFNRRRLGNIFQSVSKEARLTLAALPYLLHVNLPRLPGHAGPTANINGINNFEFNRTIADSVKTLFGMDEPPPPAPRFRPLIRSVFMSTDLGTLGQGERRTVTIYLIADTRLLGEPAQEALENRNADLHKWAKRRGLFLQFVLLDPNMVQNGDFGEVQGEPERGALALEQFYREAIYVSGEIPIWWCAAPDADAREYQEATKLVERCGFGVISAFMDLGPINLPSIDVRRRAMLARLNHEEASPLALLLNFALLIYQSDDVTPLCDRLKAQVFRGSAVAQFLDPYVLLFDAVAEELAQRGKWNELRLMSRLLYVKVAFNAIGRGNPIDVFEGRFELVRPYILRWGWEQELIDGVDALQNWAYRGVNRFDRQLREFTLGIYRLLAVRAKRTPGRFDDEEVAMLGRRLVAWIGTQPGRVTPQFNYLLQENHPRSALVLSEQVRGRDRKWTLHRCSLRDTEPDMLPPAVYEGESLSAAVTWALANGFYRRGTDVGVLRKKTHVATGAAKNLFSLLEPVVGRPDPLGLAAERFADARQIRRAMLLINFDGTKLIQERAENSGAAHVVTANWDILNYGRDRKNRVEDVAVVSRNSWDEITCRSLSGQRALARAMRHIFTDLDPSEGFHAAPEVIVPDERHLRVTRNRVQRLLDAAAEAMTDSVRPNERRVFLYESGGEFQALCRNRTKIRVRDARGLRGVVRTLNAFTETRQEIIFDQLSPSLGDLRVMFERQHSDANMEVCIGWRKTQNGGYILICDETNRVYMRRLPTRGLEDALIRLVRRIIYLIKDRAKDIRTLRRMLRVFELRGGHDAGSRIQLLEDTVRVFTRFSEPRPRHPEIFLRGDLRKGRDGVYMEYGGRDYKPARMGRRYAVNLVRKLLEHRKKYAEFNLFIEASTVRFQETTRERRDACIVRQLRLIDLYERLLGRALKVSVGAESKVMLSENTHSRGGAR